MSLLLLSSTCQQTQNPIIRRGSMSTSRRTFQQPSRLLAITFAALLLCCQLVQAQVGPATSGGYIEITNAHTGDAEWVLDDRKPSLYTGDFGDCMGDSVINVTRFDASYYKDNATVMFHLAGNTALVNESVMSKYNSSPILGVSDKNSIHGRVCLWREAFQPDLQPV